MALFDPTRRQIRIRAQTAYARAGARLQEDLKATSPRDSGDMERATRVFPRGPLVLESVVGVGYASYVREGTPPHPIVASKGKVLSFIWQKLGGRVFFKRVKHPGTKAQGWYDSALDRFAAHAQSELDRLP
jgi:hypothetical protein